MMIFSFCDFALIVLNIHRYVWSLQAIEKSREINASTVERSDRQTEVLQTELLNAQFTAEQRQQIIDAHQLVCGGCPMSCCDYFS